LAYTVPTVEPRQIESGSVAYWDASYPAFPASDGWQLTYYVRGPVDTTFAWGTEVSADGAGFAVRVPTTKTDDLTAAGGYRLVGRCTKDGEVHTVYNEPLLVLANPATAVNAKSFNRRMLEALDAALIANVANTGERQSVSANGRTVVYRDRAAIETARAHYAVLVAIEENPTGEIAHAAVFVRG
jgi:hypothetical protein